MPLDLDMDAEVRAMGGGSLTPLQRAWLTLEGARGRLVLWDYTTPAYVVLDGSNNINYVKPRVADTSGPYSGVNWYIVQTSSFKRPPRTAAAPSGLLGANFLIANSTILYTQQGEGAFFGGNMSSLCVSQVTTTQASMQRAWCLGRLSFASDYVGEYVSNTAALSYSRVAGNTTSATANDFAAHVRVSTYDAATTRVNAWLDSTQIITNVVNATAPAATLDLVAHGGKKANAESNYFTGGLWLHLLANVTWTPAEALAYTAAAKLIMGTP